MNHYNNNKDETPGLAQTPPKWLNWFLILNIVSLAGLMMWELGSAVYKSTDEITVELQKKAAQMELATSQNPSSKDFGAELSEEIEYVIDATSPNKWVHFNFSNSSWFQSSSISKEQLNWDIAIRRAKIVTNSGMTSPKGKVLVASVNATSLSQVSRAPKNGYEADIIPDGSIETSSPILDKWYRYDFWTHKLKPKKLVYIVKTWNERLAKFIIVSYYCESAPACFTIRFQYQGNLSNSLN